MPVTVKPATLAVGYRSITTPEPPVAFNPPAPPPVLVAPGFVAVPVSYTHLTLPTILLV